MSKFEQVDFSSDNKDTVVSDVLTGGSIILGTTAAGVATGAVFDGISYASDRAFHKTENAVGNLIDLLKDNRAPLEPRDAYRIGAPLAGLNIVSDPLSGGKLMPQGTLDRIMSQDFFSDPAKFNSDKNKLLSHLQDKFNIAGEHTDTTHLRGRLKYTIGTGAIWTTLATALTVPTMGWQIYDKHYNK